MALLFAAMPLHAQTMSPGEMFGFNPGDDYRLASYEQMEAYYRHLAATSDRVELREIGETPLGRTLYLLTISSPENLARQARFREISETLARARVDEATAAQLAEEGRAVVWIDGGLHATELAHGQMTTALAYRVATEESDEMRHIRDQVIFLLMPQMNPDGLEIVRKWYERTVGTPHERTNPPELYHHYVGHDNNRDFFMNNMPESKATAAVIYNEWYPQIVYNQHQISPPWARIVIPPYSDPVNPIIHPGVTTGLNEIGSAMGNRFALEDMPGAVADVGFSMWWNGGMRTVPYFHNMIGILTETGHNWPSPAYYDPKLFPRMRALRANPGAAGIEVPEDDSGVPDATVLYPYPWQGGESRFAEPVNYMITGSIAVLRAAADRRTRWLNNIYAMGRDAIEAGQRGIRNYVIPAGQRHDDEARNLVNLLLEGGVEIETSSRGFRVGDTRYPAGSYIVPAAQAFRPYVIDLLEPQKYPDTRRDPSGAARPPYDIAGWTLPMQMGVELDYVEQGIDAQTERLDRLVDIAAGSVTGDGRWGYALRPEANASVRAVNALLRQGESVLRSSAAFSVGRESFAAGSFIVRSGDATAARIEAAAAEFGIDFTGLRDEPTDALQEIRLPRVGLYKSYVASMDEGWTRWLLEDYGFELVSLEDADLRANRLQDVDAIILPHPDAGVFFGDGVTVLLNGHPPGSMPEEFTGGMGLAGALHLLEFVEAGGTLLTFGDANDFAIRQFGLPVRNVVQSASSTDFSIPGSLIRGVVDAAHPLGWGLDEDVALNVVNGVAFADRSQEGCVDDLLNQRHCYELTRGGRLLDAEPAPPAHDTVVAYAGYDLLLSGWAAGEQHIAGRTAMARVPTGDGEIILYGFRPQFRGQPRGTYKLVFNALYGASMP
ncbi:MAG: M14 family metallopeptidase [Woeseiaceae bacterium]|nr:M14 family metallopeptidase [Woeseiaceae bacterium]